MKSFRAMLVMSAMVAALISSQPPVAGAEPTIKEELAALDESIRNESKRLSQEFQKRLGMDKVVFLNLLQDPDAAKKIRQLPEGLNHEKKIGLLRGKIIMAQTSVAKMKRDATSLRDNHPTSQIATTMYGSMMEHVANLEEIHNLFALSLTELELKAGKSQKLREMNFIILGYLIEACQLYRVTFSDQAAYDEYARMVPQLLELAKT